MTHTVVFTETTCPTCNGEHGVWSRETYGLSGWDRGGMTDVVWCDCPQCDGQGFVFEAHVVELEEPVQPVAVDYDSLLYGAAEPHPSFVCSECGDDLDAYTRGDVCGHCMDEAMREAPWNDKQAW